MYCKQCGKEVASGARFCAGCGAPIGKTKAALRIGPKVWVGVGASAGIALLVVGGTFAFDKWREWWANQLLTEAYQLVQKGQEMENGSYNSARINPRTPPRLKRPVENKKGYIEALKHYEAAVQNVRTITQNYASTLAAIKLAQTDPKFGAQAFSEFEHILPRMRERALIFAAEEEDVDALRDLLEKGVDPNAIDIRWLCRDDFCQIYGENETALHISAERGYVEIVKQLIKAGANVNAVYAVTAGDAGGDFTPLTNAAQGGHAEVVKLLLEAGVDANSKANNFYCLTALGHALAGGHADIVDMLLRAGARIDYGASDYARHLRGPEVCVPEATFVAAAEGGFVHLVQRMLEAGAPPNASAGYLSGTTALSAAATNGHVDVVSLLLTAGADADQHEEYGTTALGHALNNGYIDVVDVFIKAGAKKVQAVYHTDNTLAKWITIDDKVAISDLRQGGAKSVVTSLSENLTRYRQDVGHYPKTAEGLEALLNRPPDVPNWDGPYFYLAKRVPNDPWGNKYHYESPGRHGEFDLYSLGADNAEGGEGENKDIVSWSETDARAQESASQSTQESALAAQDLGSNTPSPAAMAEAPKVQVGDTYIAESVYPNNPKLNNTTERRVLSVSDDRIDVVSKNIKSKTGKERTLQFTPEWNLVGSRNPDGTGVDFSPPLKYFEFPLYPGKTWKQTSLETNMTTGSIREFTLSATVGDWEDVSVPAGVFRALKVTTQTELIDREKGQQSTGTDVSWYAPDLRRSAKSMVTSRNVQGQVEEQVIQVVGYDLK